MLTWDLKKEDISRLVDSWRELDPYSTHIIYFYEGGFSAEHISENCIGYSQFRYAEETDEEILEIMEGEYSPE